MRALTMTAALAAVAWTGMAQQPNTVSATVSTTQAVAGATANFRVQFLDANLNSSLDTALGVVGSSGASAANLTGVGVGVQQGFVVTTYEFLITVPSGEFAATRDRLIAAQRAIANVNTQAISWSTSYTLNDDGTAKALEQTLPNLLNQARAQGTLLATAMGARLGTLATLSTPAVAVSGLNATVTLTATFAVQRD